MTVRDIHKQANRDPRVKKAKKRFLLLSIPSFFIFGIIGNKLIVNGLVVYGFLLSLISALVLLAIPTLKLMKIQRVVRREIADNWLREEEDRLLKIRETMTPAEWESYKLQLENNKLLKDLKKSSPTTRSTTTYGFTEEF